MLRMVSQCNQNDRMTSPSLDLPTTKLILVLPFTHTLMALSALKVAARNWESRFCSR